MKVSWDSLVSSSSVCLAILCVVPKGRDSVVPFFRFRTNSLLTKVLCSTCNAKHHNSICNQAVNYGKENSAEPASSAPPS